MNYTLENIKIQKYNFNYAHWMHPYVHRKKFTAEELLRQEKYLSEGDIVIDIGAFTGDTPMLYAQAVKGTGKVFSFEANPHAFEILQKNSELNPDLGIIPINKAITEEPGTYTFHYSDADYCNGGFAEEIDRGVGATGHVVPLQVEGVNLTTWLEENLSREDWGKIKFIKIDTEGYDYKILRSNKNLLQEIRPILEVEVYPALSKREVENLYDILHEIDYVPFQQQEPRNCALESLTHGLDKKQFMNLFKHIKSGEDIVAYPTELIPKDKNMLSKKDISFIQPSRNNLKYLKWSYESIRKNGGDEPTICVADDFSNDGTWEWCQKMMKEDPNFKAIRNEGPTRLGHTILYDRLINEVAPTKIVGIYHADMYLCPDALESVLEHIKPLSVVSLTRIEPPLHPDGPEKVLLDFGIEPEEFVELEDKLLEQLPSLKQGRTTEGIFAPWFLFKEDFTSIGGHDPLFAPQSKEDTDIFNRFHLNGYTFIQTWDGFVYHMTCRGSRFADGAKRNPNGEVFMKNRETDEWLTQNQRSTRNFLRKWGHYCKHDALMKPIVPPKYDIEFRVSNSNSQLLELLEPWCSEIHVDLHEDEIKRYIKKEQPNTSLDLSSKINQSTDSDIVIRLDGSSFTQQDFQIIQQLSEILQDSGEIGEFELGNLRIKINSLKEYQNELIKL